LSHRSVPEFRHARSEHSQTFRASASVVRLRSGEDAVHQATSRNKPRLPEQCFMGTHSCTGEGPTVFNYALGIWVDWGARRASEKSMVLNPVLEGLGIAGGKRWGVRGGDKETLGSLGPFWGHVLSHAWAMLGQCLEPCLGHAWAMSWVLIQPCLGHVLGHT